MSSPIVMKSVGSIGLIAVLVALLALHPAVATHRTDPYPNPIDPSDGETSGIPTDQDTSTAPLCNVEPQPYPNSLHPSDGEPSGIPIDQNICPAV